MKKLIVLVLALCMAASLAACGGNDTPDTTAAGNQASTTAPENSSDTTGGGDAPQTEGFTFTYNGTEIAMHAPAAPILEALGEPLNYTEQASCAFEGLDKTYYFGSFYLETYPMGDEDYVYGFWFADDSVTTQEGIYIGAAQADVEKAYGADSFNGSNAYIVTKGDTMLTVILENGVVSSIQYAIVLE